MIRRALLAAGAVALLLSPVTVTAARAAGGAPGAPKIVSPANGANIGKAEEQVFKLWASDPDSDRYTATITVVHKATGQSVSFSSNEVKSQNGPSPFEFAVARPPVELPVGEYTWTATAVDTAGNVGPASAPRTFVVTLSTNVPRVVQPSDGCKEGRPQPVDGVIAGAFVRVREAFKDGETWVCVRTDNFGGKVIVRNLGAGPATAATSDDQAGACSTAVDNVFAGPRPLAVGEDGSSVDVYQGAGGVWLCIQAGTVPTRLRWPASRALSAASFAFVADSATWQRPPLAVNDYYASGTCQRRGGTLNTFVNADVANGHVWIESQQDSPEVSRICFRTTNAAATSPTVTGVHGAVLILDGPGAAAAMEPKTGEEWAVCDGSLVEAQAEEVGSIHYTTTEGSPTTVCWHSTLFGYLSVTGPGSYTLGYID